MGIIQKSLLNHLVPQLSQNAEWRRFLEALLSQSSGEQELMITPMPECANDGDYAINEEVEVTVVPNPGHQFAQWEDEVKDNPRVLIANGGSYHAICAPAMKSIHLHTVPGTSIKCYVEYTGEEQEGSNIDIEVPIGTVFTVEYTGGNQYPFQYWSDGATENPHSIYVTESTPSIIEAVSDYRPSYSRVSFHPGVSDAQMVYQYSKTGTGGWTTFDGEAGRVFEAGPWFFRVRSENTDYQIDSISDVSIEKTDAGSAIFLYLVGETDKQFTVNLSLIKVLVYFKSNDPAMGTVTIKGDPSILSPIEKTVRDTITFVATPKSDDYVFARWAPDPSSSVSPELTYKVNSRSNSIVGYFRNKWHTITPSYNTSLFTVTVNEQAKEGTTVSFTIQPGVYVNMTSLIITDSTGNSISYVKERGAGKYHFTMPADNVVIRITGSQTPYHTLDVGRNLPCSVEVTIDGVRYTGHDNIYDVIDGSIVTIKCVPESGWSFLRWSNGSTSNPYTFVMPSSNLSITPELYY